ncbi:MAG: anthranilate synthase component I family protein, partial [Dissulfurispiraceae bacterium]
MKLNLNKTDFLNLTGRGGGIPPLFSEIPYCDPCLVYERLSASRKLHQSILLESVKGPQKIARYSFIAFEPYLVLHAKNGELNVCSTVCKKNSISIRPPLDRLKELVSAYPQLAVSELPPFQGGAIGLLSYDFVRYLEDIPRNAVDDLDIPDIHFMMADRVIAFDHVGEKAWIIICPGARHTDQGFTDLADIDWNRSYDEAEEGLRATGDRLIGKDVYLQQSCNLQPFVSSRGLPALLNYEMSKTHYMEMVRRTKEYIAAGDIFQANLSQRLSAFVGSVEPWNIYKMLRHINPSPFAAFADFGSYSIVSSSPERLVAVRDRVIETRPIAGTRPRGQNVEEDALMRTELLLNEKERAEHIMLIDLERNDIGRVSEFGSVYVDELMITEDYSHVIHIVSNIRGLLESGKTCFDLIRAAFPGGTITGVPKVRCMEIIDELEPVARGPYTGSLGYIGFSGVMDLNIIIRSFVLKDGYAYVQAGAGIVADSDAER